MRNKYNAHVMGSYGEGRCGQLAQEENTADEPWRWQGEQLSDSDARVEMHSAMKYLYKKLSIDDFLPLMGCTWVAGEYWTWIVSQFRDE